MLAMTTVSHARLAWREGFSVGVLQIDEQHKHLIAMLNQVADLVEHGRDDGRLPAILIRLVRYTEGHFATEEQLMRDHHYPSTVAHIGQHLALTKRVIYYKDLLREDSTAILPELLVFLTGWLERHILASDRRLGAFLRESGVT
jgi:hemerythrin